MGDDHKRRAGTGRRKVRVDFRRNRTKPAREKDWTSFAEGGAKADSDPRAGERVVTKGALSRKRTVVVHDADPEGAVQAHRTGTVVTLFGRVAHVDDGERVWPCTVRRVLRTRRIADRGVVTVGDRVRFTVAERDGVEAEGVIESIEPRRGELKRVTRRREHTVVANVDQVVIVASADSPKPHLVDRYIVSTLHGRMMPVVCLNKIDLITPAEVEAFLSVYARLGYATLGSSAVERRGIDDLAERLAGRSSVLAGQSGVGKSSLLNALQPGLGLKVGSLAMETSKGRHTTTRATLLKLDIGGYVVDTPGVRSFDLGQVPRERLEEYFREFVDMVPHCRFADCTHIHEVGCAVRGAVDAGRIDRRRYGSYVRLFTDAQHRRSSDRKSAGD